MSDTKNGSVGFGESSARVSQDVSVPTERVAAERSVAFERGIASTSHAIATPLQIIAGRASLIAQESADPAASEHARVIERKVRELSDFLRNILEFARGAQDQAALDLRAWVSREIEARRPLSRELTLHSELSVEEATIVVSRELLQVAVSGVIEEVVGNCRPGEALAFRIERVDGCVRWSIELPRAPAREWANGTQEAWMNALDGRGSERRRALGLGVAIGALKRLGARRTIQPIAGDRWCFAIDFP